MKKKLQARVLWKAYANQKLRLNRLRRALGFELLEPRLPLDATNWTNPFQRLDVSGDKSQSVDPLDVLTLVNEINGPVYTTPTNNRLPNLPATNRDPHPFFDVDCDGYVSPLDVLSVVNAINSGVIPPGWSPDSIASSDPNVGFVSSSSCGPMLHEGTSYITQISSDIAIPPGASLLHFRITNPTFDTASTSGMKDAFEAALVDQNGQPLVLPFSRGKDAFVNMSEGQAIATAPGVTVSNDRITVNVSQIPGGTLAKLVVRLVNNDQDTLTAAGIYELRIDASGPVEPPIGVFASTDNTPGPVDLQSVSDITSQFDLRYRNTTSFFENTQIETTVVLNARNGGDRPVAVGISRLSDPTVVPLGISGRTADSLPYYRVTPEGNITLRFANPNRVPFTYDLTIYGTLNRAPKFSGVPDIEVLITKPYSYVASAIDPDGDPLSYSLLVGPTTMTLDVQSGAILWSPQREDLGNHDILVEVRDNHGASQVQSFRLSVIEQTPNRPPVITSVPVTEAFASKDASTARRNFILKSIVRDQLIEHPDFEGDGSGFVPGLVEPILGSDGTPIFAGPDGSGGITSQGSFFQWFHDVDGVNRSRAIDLPLKETVAGSGIYQYRNNSFFPIDDLLFGNEGLPHNYHFTLHAESDFTYRGGEVFEFSGDDDLWVFINNRLVIDLGGVHPSMDQSVSLDTLGLMPGKRYSMDLFFAERHTSHSNFVLTTTIDFASDPNYNYPVIASDADGDTLNYALLKSPPGMTINQEAGLISWKPASDQIGEYQVKLQVTDQQGGLAEQDFFVNVFADPTNTAPVFASLPITQYKTDDFTTTTRPLGSVAPNQIELWVGPDGKATASISLGVGVSSDNRELGAFTVGDVFTGGAGPVVQLDSNLKLIEYLPSPVYQPIGKSFDRNGNLFYGDWGFGGGNTLLRTDRFGALNPPGQFAHVPGAGIQSTATDMDGNIYVGFGNEQKISKVSPQGTVLEEFVLEQVLRGANAIDLAVDQRTLFYATYTAIPESFGAIKRYDIVERRQLPDFATIDGDQLYGLRLLPDGGVLVGTGFSGVLRFDRDGNLARTYDVFGRYQGAYHVALSSDGKSFYSGSSYDVSQFDISSGEWLANWEYDFTINNYLSSLAVFDEPRAGTGFGVGALDVEVSDPTISLRNITGPILAGPGDTVTFDVELTFDSESSSDLIRRSFDISFFRQGWGYPIGRIPVAVNGGVFYRYAVNAVDADGDQIRYSLAESPTNAAIDPITGLLRWQPTSPGVSRFVIEADDGKGGRAQQSFDVLVTASSDNRQPNITSTPRTRTSVNNTFAYRVASSDPDGDSISFLLTKSPGGMAINHETGLVQWTPGVSDVGIHEISIVALDGRGGQAVQTYQLEITPTSLNRPPTITSSPLLEATVGQTYQFQATATDPDPDATSFDLVVAPDGMVISPFREVVWSPTPAQVGSHQVILRVADGRTGIDLQSFQVLVAPLNSTPIITSNPAMRAIAQSPYVYAVRAQDADGDVLRYRLNTAPTGMTINPASGKVQWFAATSQIGKHSVIIAADDSRGGTTLQSFEIEVVSTDLNVPPVFTSTPRTSIQIGRRYIYVVDAFDPSGDRLSYSLLTAPTGMTLSEDGLVQWQPTADQLGNQPVSIQVDDGRGGIIRQDYIVNVTSQPVNSAPTIVTSPRTAATLGLLYQYDAQATDADGDSLVWNLLSAPDGMSIDPNRGTIRWTPTSAQHGQHRVEFDVLDGQGGRGSQSFTLMVRSDNLPPLFESSPPTKATLGRPYVYEAIATDLDGDSLIIALIKNPSGMSLDLESGLVNWMPGAEQLGPHEVELLVTDSRGATVRQSYTVVVSELAEDTPPIITSSPNLAGSVGTAYTYLITANDPEDQPISFGLTTGPADMTIVGSTLQWSPTTSEVGNHLITVVAMDPAGNRATQSFTISVRQSNRRPEPNGDQLQFATPGELHQDIVRILDPDGDALVYIIDQAPQGLAVDTFGRITWLPTRNDVGVHDIQITARDPYGLGKFVNYQMLVVEDTEAPLVAVSLSNNPVNIGDPVFAVVTASDDSFIDSILLTYNGIAVPLDASGRASLPTTASGRFDVVATATDGAGNTGRASVVLSVGVPRVEGDPIVTITSPKLSIDPATSRVTARTDIIGTVNDPDLAFYTLSIAPASGGDFVEIARGTQSVNDGVLGKFDPSILQNDDYLLRLYAVDIGGNDSEFQTVISVAGELKLGNFTLSFTDLSITVPGVPITVTRTYSSFNANQQDDLGYGWRLEIRDTDLRTSVPGTGLEESLIYNAFYDGARVYVTLPGGKREGFTFRPQLAPGLRGSYLGIFYPRFVPDPGNTSELSVPQFDLFTTNSGEMISASGSLPYNPASSTFGSNYIVTTKEGIAFEIDGDTGDLLTVVDTNDNTLTYTDNGIISSTGKSVVFERDARGRITAVKDPSGNRVIYQYDDRGDLVSVTDREGNTTRFEYRSDRQHYLEKVIDPLGRPGIRSEYDASGRLIKLFDANGNAVEMIHDLDNSVQTIKDPLGNATTYEFDRLGNIVREVDALGGVTRRTYADPNDPTLESSITDPLGNTTSLTYDNRGNVLTQRDALGNVTISTYQQITYGNSILAKLQGQAALPFSVPSTTTDPLGNTSTNSYDNRGSLTSIIDPSGLSTEMTYDIRGNPTTMDLGGNATQFVYDNAGRVIRQTDALNHATTYTYDTNGNQVTETRSLTTPGGVRFLVTTLEYDKNGRVVSVKNPEGNVTRTEYNSAGNKIADIDALGRRTEYRYDERGQLTETIFPDATPSILTDNPRTHTEYDAAGRETARIDELGRRTEFQYDKLGRKTFTIYPDATPGNPLDNPRTQTVYDAAGQVVAQIDERGNRTEFVFDAAGRQTIVRDALAFSTTSTYDTAGRQIAQKNALGHNTQFEFDAAGRILKTIYADNSTTSSTYDSAGRLTARTDQAGRVTRYEYDQLGRLLAVIDALDQRTEYNYNEAGNLVSQKDANSHVTRYEYDGLGRRIATVLPLGQRSLSEYNAIGNLVRAVDFNGDAITFSYDIRDRLTAKNFPDATSVQFTYNSVGQRQTYVDTRGITQYVYDERDRLVSRTDPDGKGINYTYDVTGNRTSLTTPAGTTSFTFDVLNRPDTVIDPESGVTDYTYDAVSNLIRTDLPNGTRETRTYDTLSRLTFLENRGASDVISSYRYTLSPTGRRDAVLEATGRRVNYSYDRLDRLTREAITDAAFGDRTFDYTYDPVGNRMTRSDTVEGLTIYDYDDNDRLFTENLAGQTARYTYDNNGNTLTRQSPTEHVIYDWDFENRLISVDTNGDGTVDVRNFYDAEGIRVAQTVTATETRFLIDTVQPYAQVAMEYTPAGIIKVSYVHGNDLISQNRPSETGQSFYHVDGLGSTRALSNALGIIIGSYVYDAFGRTIGQVGNVGNVYLFAGEQRDAVTGLDYLRARYMNPSVGRFASRDRFAGFHSQPNSLNRYVYTMNNPLTFVDPSGHFVSLAGVVAGLATNSITSLAFDVPKAAKAVGATAIISLVMRPGFEMRNRGLLLIADGVDTGFDMYSEGNRLIALGAGLIAATNKLVDYFDTVLSFGKLVRAIPKPIVVGRSTSITSVSFTVPQIQVSHTRMITIAERLMDRTELLRNKVRRVTIIEIRDIISKDYTDIVVDAIEAAQKFYELLDSE